MPIKVFPTFPIPPDSDVPPITVAAIAVNAISIPYNVEPARI